jgi:molybdenum cofactor guanylyltransferase
MVAKTGGTVGGIVLAGGQGRRIGGAKAVVELGGAALVTHAVAMLTAVCDGPVVVSARAETELPPGLGVATVCDAPGDRGPLAGIVAGLTAIDCDDAIILACDLPLAGPALRLLAGGPVGRASLAAAPIGRQPLCARVPRAAAAAAARRLIECGRPTARALMGALNATEVAVPDSWLLNVNTPDDAAAAARLLSATPGPGVKG